VNEHPSCSSRTGYGGEPSRRWRVVAAVVEPLAAGDAATARVVKRPSSEGS